MWYTCSIADLNFLAPSHSALNWMRYNCLVAALNFLAPSHWTLTECDTTVQCPMKEMVGMCVVTVPFWHPGWTGATGTWTACWWVRAGATLPTAGSTTTCADLLHPATTPPCRWLCELPAWSRPWSARTNKEDVPLVEFVYLVFTCMPGESYCRWLGSLLLHSVWCLLSAN